MLHPCHLAFALQAHHALAPLLVGHCRTTQHWSKLAVSHQHSLQHAQSHQDHSHTRKAFRSLCRLLQRLEWRTCGDGMHLKGCTYSQLPHTSRGSLCRLLQRTDWFTQEKACMLLVAILECRPSDDGTAQNGNTGQGQDNVEHVVTTFVDWLSSQLRWGGHPHLTWIWEASRVTRSQHVQSAG